MKNIKFLNIIIFFSALNMLGQNKTELHSFKVKQDENIVFSKSNKNLNADTVINNDEKVMLPDVNKNAGQLTFLKRNSEKIIESSSIIETSSVKEKLLRKCPKSLYFGTGFLIPSSRTKEGANSVNRIDFNISYYHPFWAWEKNIISLGINTELGYNLGIGERDFKSQYNVYNMSGQSQLPTISNRGMGSIQSQDFRAATGLQFNVHLSNMFTISPIINAGYLSTNNKSFSVTEKTYFNGSEYNYVLLSQKESKTSGLGFLPKIRMTYNITQKLGIWLEGNYTFGPKIKTDITNFIPEPSASVNGDYTLSQFEAGSYTTTKKVTSFNTLGITGGIVFSFKQRSSERLRHKNK